MGTLKVLKLSILMVFILLTSKTFSQQFRVPVPPHSRTPTPLCISQFALVNHACSMLPYRSGLPPPASDSTPLPSSPEDEHEHRNSRHRRGSDSVDTGRPLSPVEQDCCRWLKELDRECVCNLLVQLPPFLSRPMHNYTIVVDGACVTTFQCPGRLLG